MSKDIIKRKEEKRMKEHNNLEFNLLNKIKSWVYRLFHKSQQSISSSPLEQSVDSTAEKIKQDNFFDEYKLKNERRQYLLDLQKKYKAKEILEKDMSEEDKIDLENLYIEQNEELKRKIKSYDYKMKKA